jgi:hypothetical protein
MARAILDETELAAGLTPNSALSPTPQLPSEENEVLTMPEGLPVRSVGRGCIALEGGRYSTLLKVEALDVKLMSQTERNGFVKRFAGLLNSLSGAFSFVYDSRPRNMAAYIAQLDARRIAETNPDLRQQYWTEMDFLTRLHQANSLTERNYYLALQATPADTRHLPDVDDETDDAKAGLWDTFNRRFQTAVMGKDSESEIKQLHSNSPHSLFGTVAGSYEHGISPILADALRFRGQSLADALHANGMSARLLDDTEIVQTLGEMLHSPLAGMSKLNPLYGLGGASLTETPEYLLFNNDTYAGCLYVTDYPKTLRLGALFEIVRFKDIQMTLALQVRPLPNSYAENKLKNRQQILFAVAANDSSQAGDFNRAYKIESIKALRDTLARGDARLFSIGIRLVVRAKSRKRLAADLRRVGQRLAEMGYGVATATRNQRRAFFSALPLGHDWLAAEKLISDRAVHPNLTGENIACLVPNCIIDASDSAGIILGVSKSDGSLICYDRWRGVNPHTVICATSGSGKTVAMQIEILREILKEPLLGAYYIDPQGVLGNFARLVGGTVLDLGQKGGAIINPLDRYVIGGKPEDIGERITFLYALLTLMVDAELAPSERAAISRAVKRLYHHFEDGESMLGVLERNFLNNPLYEPLRPVLPEVMVRLNDVYTQLRAKHKLPTSGLVRGVTVRSDNDNETKRVRPICKLVASRWTYSGDGETDKPLNEPDVGNEAPTGRNGSPSLQNRPAGVWYPAPDWFRDLASEFERAVQDAHIFDRLDKTARSAAIRDAFVELKLGMPILSDLFPFLAGEGALNLVTNLEQFVDPEMFGKLFNGYTNVALDRRFIVFDVRDLGQDQLRPIRIFQTINFTWGQVRAIRQPRMFVIDEFGLLVQNFADVGNYVRDLFMRGRAFYLSMTAIVQNIASLLDVQSARACIENAERVILMRQQKSAIHRLKTHFELTDGQIYQLLGAEPGEALEFIDGRWLHVQYSVSPEHLAAFDTRPRKTAKN